jgi:hypothetical protein
MRRRESDPQAAAAEEHDRQARAGELGEQLRVTREGEARVVDDALVHGRSDQSRQLAAHAALDGEAQGFDDGARVSRIERAGARRVRERHVHDLEPPGHVRTRSRRAVVCDELEVETEAVDALREQIAIRVCDEARRPRRAGGSQAQLGADARRLPGGERQRRLHQRRIST